MFKKFAAEFREFAMKGNVLDMAVGIVIGVAFGKIVASLVDNIVMPLVGALGKADVSALWKIPVGEAEVQVGAFAQTVIDFLIIAFAIFMVIKAINHFKRDAPTPEVTAVTPEDVLLLREIRDELKKPKSA